MVVLHLALRELRSIFVTGRAWWLVAFWLLTAGAFWFSLVDNYVSQSQDLVFNPYAASLLNLGDYLIAPWFGNMWIVCLMVGPVFAARMFSEEYKQKSIELLLTSPLHTWELVAGKYLGAMGFVAVLLLATAHVPIGLYQFADPDWGHFVGGYLSLFLLMSLVVSFSLFASSLTESTMIAVFGTMLLLLGWFILSWQADDPDGVIAQLSMASHLEDVIRGSLRLSDLAWFAATTLFFLFATQQRLESFRWS